MQTHERLNAIFGGLNSFSFLKTFHVFGSSKKMCQLLGWGRGGGSGRGGAGRVVYGLTALSEVVSTVKRLN